MKSIFFSMLILICGVVTAQECKIDLHSMARDFRSFVKFLIDRYGIDKLRKFYQCSDINQGFKTTYNKELTMAVKEWKSYVLSNVNK